MTIFNEVATLEDLVYAASTVDCEGCVTITKRYRDINNPYYGLKVTISNTKRALIDWLYDTFGGNTHEKYNGPGRKLLYTWQIHGEAAADFLSDVLPYMKLKNEQAEVGIELVGLGSSVDVEIRQLLKGRINKLNTRGIEIREEHSNA